MERHERAALVNGYWDGGSRSSYLAVELSTGRTSLPDGKLLTPPQFGGTLHTPTVEIPSGIAILEHTIVCGKDRGVIIHVRPEDFQLALPAGDLTEDEQSVIDATCAYKSSYGGVRDYRRVQSGLSPERWEAAKATLIEKGMLNRAGAVTTAGKNARKR